MSANASTGGHTTPSAAGDRLTPGSAGADSHRPLSILLTNLLLSGRTGTEVATVELAQALRRRGHRAAIFSPTLGETALEARGVGIPVTNRIEKVGIVPDIIHGNHNLPLAMALLMFPQTPAVFVCHDSQSPFDEPIVTDAIGRYVAVDAACRDRMVFDGIDPAKVSIVPNAVDLARFTNRTAWQARPRTALLVLKQRTGHLAVVEEACAIAGIALEVVGRGVGRIVTDLADRCRSADIVFAYSRSAIEAAAVGAAVIVIDEFGYGGWLGREQVTAWPETSLSNRILSPLPSADRLAEVIAQYDGEEARTVTALLRDQVDIDRLAGQWEGIYAETIGQAGSARVEDRHQGGILSLLSRYISDGAQVSEMQQAARRAQEQAHVRERHFDLLRAASTSPLDRIAFHAGALGQVMLAAGWYMAEDWGVWSASERAVLWVPDFVLEWWGFAFETECRRYCPASVSGEAPRSVAVFVGVQCLAEWHFTAANPYGPDCKTIEVPGPVRPPPGQSLRLEFRTDRHVSPSETGEGIDTRAPGVGLIGLRQAAR